MEIKKCIQCGGNLKRLRVQRAWICPYCDARYEDEIQEKTETPAEYYGLNEEVFSLEDISKVMKNSSGAECIRSIVHCMDKFETSDEVEAYILKKLSFSDDISVPGVREEQIKNALPLIRPVMESGERVIVYGNKGIFSKGKEFFVVTDKRTVFVKKKDVKTVLHTDLDSLKIEPCANCYLNGKYDQGIVNLDGSGKFQGALIALICMRSLEAEPDRERIQLL